MKYINTTRDTKTAAYVRTEPSFDGAEVDFSITPVQPKINGESVKMVRGIVRLTEPSEVVACDDRCVGHVNEVMELRFNVRQGGESLEALLAEVTRVYNVAVDNYQIANGVVPPVTAQFSV